MLVLNPSWKTLFGGMPDGGGPQSADADPPSTQDRLCAKFDAARMIHQLRQHSGLSEAQFAARLGLKPKDVAAAEIGNFDYQHTMDIRDRAQAMFGSAEFDPDIQPQAERSAASALAAWIRQLPD